MPYGKTKLQISLCITAASLLSAHSHSLICSFAFHYHSLILKHLKMRVIDNKPSEHAVSYTNQVCIVGSLSHEFIIIAFYDEGAGLVAMLMSTLPITFGKFYTFSRKQCRSRSAGFQGSQLIRIYTDFIHTMESY